MNPNPQILHVDEMGQQPTPPQAPVPFQPGELNLNLTAIVKSPLFWMTVGGIAVWYLMSSGKKGN